MLQESEIVFIFIRTSSVVLFSRGRCRFRGHRYRRLRHGLGNLLFRRRSRGPTLVVVFVIN